MKSTLSAALMLSAALVASAALAQGAQTTPTSGLYWSVAAPRGASWSLECRFAPVTIQNKMLNRYAIAGTGAQRGRLPGQDGRCTLTKTGGDGPVGVALVKNGQATAAGTNDPAAPARINVF